MKQRFAVPDYLPDQTPNSGSLEGLSNAYPIVNGFAPVRAFQSVSDAVSGDFKGGAAVIANDGTSYLLVGTSTHLLRYASGAWTTLVSGLSITDQWQFQGFGNYVVAVNGSATYEVDLVAGTASTITGAPSGTSVAEIQGYIGIGQTSGSLIRFNTSVINDHSDWVIANGSTRQDQLAGGEIMGLAGGEYGVILQRRRIVRVTPTGDTAVRFDYAPVAQNVGCASKGSVATYDRTAFFLADQGFMRIDDGQVVRPIGTEKVDRTFQQLVPADDYERIYSAVDPVRKLVVWCVPGSPGFLFFYNYDLDKWGIASMNVDGVFSAFTSSETLEGVSAANPDLDAMTVSLDDPSFSGGNPQLYVVQDGQIGTLTGSTLEAVFEYGFMELAPGRRATVRHLRPISDAVNHTITLAVSGRQGDEGTVKTAGTVRASGRIPVRASGRYHRLTQIIPAGEEWSYNHAFEVEYDARGDR